MKKKVLSMILAFVMVISCLMMPATASRTETQTSETFVSASEGETVISVENGEIVTDVEETNDTTEVEILVRVENGETVYTQTSDLELAMASVGSQRAGLYAAASSMEAQLEMHIEVDEYFSLVFNGFAFTGEAWMVDAINEMEGLSAIVAPTFELVEPEEESSEVDLSPNMETATGMVGATDAWELGYTGKGMVIAVIDSGIKQTHEAFSVDPEGAKIDQKYLDDLFAKYGELMHGQNTEGAYYSAKMPYNWDYFDDDCTPNHTNTAHGSHVAGIAAGNNGSDFKGVAPDAQIISLQIFNKSGGASSVDLLSAMEDCVYLGVDCINMSIGITAGFEDYEWIGLGGVYDALDKAGIAVVTSAGNDGHGYHWTSYGDFLYNTFRWLSSNPDNGMIGNPGNLAGSFTVANTVNISGGITATIKAGGYTENPIASTNPDAPWIGELSSGTYEIVLIGSGSPEDIAAVGGVEGKLALAIVGGDLTEDQKCANAADAGAIGIILYGPAGGTITTAPKVNASSSIPVCVVSNYYGKNRIIARAMKGGTSGEITLTCTPFSYDRVTMAMSSSWGPTPNLKLKPEIAAPGTNITSVDGKKTKKDDAYTKMTGTSMSAPAVSGGVLVLKQYLKTIFPDATNKELYEKAYALMMSTAGHADAFVRQQGAGVMNLENATKTTVYLTDSQGNRPKLELGENETGTFKITFNLTNFGETNKTYKVGLTALTEQTSQYTYEGYNQMSRTPEFAKKTNRYPWLHQAEEITVCTGTIWDVSDQCTLEGTKAITVKAGETVTLTFTLKANESLMTHFAENCPAGMYLEGWINLTDTSKEDAVNLSIPYLGYVGDWDQPAMIDEGYWWQNAYGVNNMAQFYASNGVGGIYLGYDALEQGLGVNLYADGTGETYLDDRNAISPNGDGYLDSLNNLEFSLLRQPRTVKIYITDADGNVLKTIEDITYGFTRDYGGPSQSYPLGYSGVTFDYACEDLEENETAYFIMETYLAHDGFKLEDNDLAQIKVPFYKDLTAPVVTAIPGGVEIQDTNYVAYYAVYTDAQRNDMVFEDGVFAMERGVTETYLTDMDRYFVSVADYAHNEAFYYVVDGTVYEMDAEGFDRGRTIVGESQWNMTRYEGGLSFTHCSEHAWYAFSDNLQQAVIPLTEVDYELNPYDEGLAGAADIDWVDKTASGDVYAMSSNYLYKFDPLTCTVDRESGVKIWMEGITRYTYLLGFFIAPGTNDFYGVAVIDRNPSNGWLVSINPETGEMTKMWQVLSGGVSNGKKLSNSYKAFTMKDAQTLLCWGTIYGTNSMYYLFAEIDLQTGEVKNEIPMYGWEKTNMGNMRTGDFDMLGSKWMLLYDDTQNCVYLSGCWSAFGYMHKDKGGIARYDFDTDTCKWFIPGDGSGLVMHGLYFLDEMVPEEALECVYYIEEVAPTCTAEGYTLHTCADCGKQYRDNYVPALGHAYEAVVTEPTCTEEGYTTYTCTSCGDSYVSDYVLPTEHPYTAVVVEPTCTTAGYTMYICNVCGDSYMADVTETIPHSYEAYVVEPTCDDFGYTVCTCTVCGDSYVTDYTEPYCPAENFTDVALSDWYHEAVDFVVENELMNGMSENVFAPNANMTRAQLVTVLYRLAGKPSVEGMNNPFTDVAADAWYTDAAIWAANEGIVKGMTETTFAPGANITREQLVTILYRFNGEAEVDEAVLDSYTDAANVSDWATEAFAWAVENGIIEGVTESTLAPQGSATRAQIATILMRYCAN